MPAKEIIGHETNSKQCKLWRYMDLTKFLDLISSKSIFLSRVDKFEDPLEGTLPEGNNQFVNNSEYIILKEFYRFSEDLIKNAPKWSYVNCWHKNEYESAAMWKLYSKTNESIAIETTYEKLKNILPDTVSIGEIKYIDYDTESLKRIDHVTNFFHKRKSFVHENEVRVYQLDERVEKAPNILLSNIDNDLKGINIAIKIEQLIDIIHVSPSTPKWFYELIKKVVNEDYQLSIEVRQSNLYKRLDTLK